MIAKKVAFSVLMLSLGLLSSCGDNYGADKIPITYVSEEFKITNAQYANLWRDGGWVYFANSGYRGLIIYHQSGNTYRVFERACPYDPRSDCDPIEVDDSGLFMIHKCCGSTFDFNGQPTGGPAELPMRQYSAYLDADDFLIIRSDL